MSIRIEKVSRIQIEESIQLFVDIIYHNFIELTQYPYVEHTPKSIQQLLEADELFGYIVRFNNKFIGYLFGKTDTMPDGRLAYYLSYIYISPNYRKQHLGSLLMKKLINDCHKIGLSFIVLTCDFKDEKLVQFYKKLGFIVDPILKKNKRHDVLCLYL